jgi:chromosome segregation protein
VRVKKLTIFGFKSFAQKVEILFEGAGLTSIVGPNGCGKSNIVDAIRWVMGSKSPDLLRMDKMQGVIFAGTAERKAMNIAEVSLVIENDRGLLPSEYSEVMVTRRATSEGSSEYLINNQECRRIDIINLFADTGMGADSYSQMDKRMTEALLSNKADERRTIFEEAAGVSKYKKQRNEATARLERTLAEMEPVLASLQSAKNELRKQEKMVARAEELKNLKNSLKELDVSAAILKYTKDKTALHTLSAEKNKNKTELDTLKIRLNELETKIDERQLLISADEENFRECQKEASEAATEAAKLNEAYVHMQKSEKDLEENKERCENEISKSENEIQSLKNEMQNLENELKNLVPEIEDMETQSKKETGILQNLRNAVDKLRIEHRELSNKRFKFIQAEGKLKEQWQRTDAEIELFGERISQISTDIQTLDSKIQEMEFLKTGKEYEINENKNKLEIIAERQNVLENERETLNETIIASNNQKKEILDEKTRKESRLEALQSINNSGSLEGNKWLLNNNAGTAALLSNQIEVIDSKYAALVEFCLDSSIQALLMPSCEAALACEQALSNESLGRALLAWNANIHEENLNEPGAVAISSLVKHNENSSCLIKNLLSKYFLVSDLKKAAELALTYAGKDLWFCTENCQAVNSIGLAKIGKEAKENYGILQQNTEIKSLEAEIVSLNEKAETLSAQITLEREKLQENSALISNNFEDKQSIDAFMRKAYSEAEVLGAGIHALKAQKEKNEQDISNFETKLQELRNARNSNVELNAAEQEFEQAEREFKLIDSEIEKQEQALKNQEELTTELANSLSEKKKLQSQKGYRFELVKEQIQTMNKTLVLRSEELESINSKTKSLQRELEAQALQIEKQYELLKKKEALRDAAQEKYTVMAGDIEEWRSEVREINRSLHDKDRTVHEQELAIQASATALERIRERIGQEYDFDLEKEPSEQNFTILQIDEREANVEIHNLRERISSIGPINATAAEDFEAEKERVRTIEASYSDLNGTKNSLLNTIEIVDRAARDRFLDTFRKIQRNYHDVFSSLMPGGEVLLTMQSDADPLEAEIMINARPPGKKMINIKALSEGEKALTATSLLFALYMVKPPPYCILDEIDGPLDDANIGRFMALLRRFSHQTQFVLITHNKRTMAASDRLYGVTQEIKGISQVGSVRLEDVEELKI